MQHLTVLPLLRHICSFNQTYHLRPFQSKIQNAEELVWMQLLSFTNELSLLSGKVASLGEEAAQVFDAHMMVLADPEMIGQIKETIRTKKKSMRSSWLERSHWHVHCNLWRNGRQSIHARTCSNPRRYQTCPANLLGKKLPNPASINEEAIVVAHTDTIWYSSVEQKYVKPLLLTSVDVPVTQLSWRVHLKSPAVLGTNNITELVKDGDVLLFQGSLVWWSTPTEEQIAAFKAAGEAYAKKKKSWMGSP